MTRQELIEELVGIYVELRKMEVHEDINDAVADEFTWTLDSLFHMIKMLKRRTEGTTP